MKVLIIEQTRSLLNALTRFVTSLSHEATPVFDGVIGVNEFDDSYDAIIIDYQVPRITYLETIQLLKKKKPNLFVFVLLDSFFIPEDLLIENELVNDFFSSPFQASELAHSLESVKTFKPRDIVLTIKESEILEELENNEYLPLTKIDKKIFKEDDVSHIINALNEKLKRKQIVSEEKGFKLVKKDD